MLRSEFKIFESWMESVMADLSGLTAAVNALVETQSMVIASLADLAGKVAAAEAAGVPQSAVDALTAQVQGVVSGLQAAAAANDPKPVVAPAAPGA